MTTVTPRAPQQQKPESEPRRPRRWPWIVLVAIVALAGGLWLGMFLIVGGELESTSPTVVDTPDDVEDGNDPTDPTAPVDPAAPVTPADPADPADPTSVDPAAPVDPTTPEPVVRSYDLTVADALAEPVDGTVLVDAPWGTEIGAVGLMQATFGPCCFDVYDIDSVVVLDSQNQRLVDYPAGGEPRVIAEFDAAEFNPAALAVFGDRVILAGTTSDPGFPSEIVAVSMLTGKVLGQVQSAAPMTVDLRATSEGVFWAEPGSSPDWTAVADSSGELLTEADQVTTDYLPGEANLDWNWDAGVSISVQPAGDTPQTVYNVIEEEALFGEVLSYQRWADGVIVLFGGAFDDDGLAPVKVFELGTAPDGLVSANLYSIEIARWAETGSFGTFRYGFGALYVLNTTEDGVQIVRYDF